jgi:mRNA interferase RelE/StbE
MAYEVKLLPGAQEDFEGLDGSVQKQALKQLGKLKEKPEVGKELGERAGMDLTGYHSIRFAKGKYRIVYQILKDRAEVDVWAIGKREREEVYRAVASRLKR